MEDPVLYIYHDVITDYEIERMKKESLSSVKKYLQ